MAEGVERVEPVERPLAASTLGRRRRTCRTWDSPAVAELAFAARSAELRTVAAAARLARDRTALARAARELLALQASDWAFQITRDLAGRLPARSGSPATRPPTRAL